MVNATVQIIKHAKKMNAFLVTVCHNYYKNFVIWCFGADLCKKYYNDALFNNSIDQEKPFTVS